MDGWTDERADRWTNKQKLVILESLFLQKNPYSTQFRLYPELDQSLLSYDVMDARKEKKSTVTDNCNWKKKESPTFSN